MTEPTLQDFRLIHRLRVRWAEVDQQRIVFNPHYLMYIDTAFTEYWRALAIPYESIPVLLGGDLYVKKSSVEYHGSARLDDLLQIGLKCARIGNSSMVFQSAIFKGDEALVTGELVYVFADPQTQTSKPVPGSLRELLLSYEAGATPVRVEVAAWAEAATQASALRRAVFNEELRYPLDLGLDATDPTSVHALVRNSFGQLLATARLADESPGVARIARVAVSRAMRGAGYGRRAVEALVQHAIQHDYRKIVLRSQHSAVHFFADLGFTPVGEPFVEAGVAHLDMDRDLTPR